ncbi:hypothetical protein OVA03_08455 [Asticcacaulis sp. SL142]|uniref:hypothetical protein n=1 Tax=Asticcacaulis sp. SL142 TaxID=2995155 RepID=UPI00226CA8F2|nr:hypothetical protein [Asticcacaulis sp. SL142]WAC46751.1 hypothetical protein OVA03_08455 [Asticcacaulis sp. SL142]
MTKGKLSGQVAIYAILGIGALLGGVIGYLEGAGIADIRQNPQLAMIVVTVFILLALAFSIVWWRSSDEAVREAHKWAWYWGGSCGLLVVMPIYFLSVATGGDFGESFMAYFNAQGSGFEFGIMTGLIPPIIGYVIAWGIWWLRHR